MDKFLHFNVYDFLREAPTWDDKLEEKRMELESITELKGFENSPGSRSTTISNPVAVTAEQREKVLEEIATLEQYKSALAYVMKRVSPEQKEILWVFFSRGRIDSAVDRYGAENGMCRSDVYSLRRETMAEVEKIILEKYFPSLI